MSDTPKIAATFELPDELVEALAERVAARVAEHLRRDADFDRWMPTREAAQYLGLTVAALHRLTARREIPFEQDKPGGKCWFKRSELDAWRAS